MKRIEGLEHGALIDGWEILVLLQPLQEPGVLGRALLVRAERRAAAVRLQRAGAERGAGNRLAQTDSTGSVYTGPSALLSYTARSQLYFSMTPTAQVGTYDYNWH